MSLTIGILRGIKAPIGMPHVPQHIIEDVAGGFRVARVATDQVSVEIQLGQLRIVVQHLLEVGHQPLRIDRVPRKPAAQVIVDAPGRHPLTGVQHHLDGVLVLKTFREPQQESGLARLGKLGRIAKPAIFRVVGLLEEGPGVTHDIRCQDQRG